MMDFLRRRGPTAIAVAVAFIAGGATVTTAQTVITGSDIKNGSIKNADLGKGAVNSPKIQDGQVKTADIGKGTVNSKKIKNAAVANADLAANAVNSAKIANGGVANADLAANAVNSAKIASGGVANADLAANAVNSAKVADNTLTAADLASNAVASAELAGNAVNSAKVADGAITSADIANGTIGTVDISAAALEALTFAGANWSIVDRNVIGNGDAYLRAGPTNGPVAPPSGIGSLGVRTGSPDDAAAFGNQVNFIGMPVSDLTAVGYEVFTTQENNARALNNMPAIAFEIDPNITLIPSNFSTMSYQPGNGFPLVWTPFNAVTDPDPHWSLSGNAFIGTPCHADGPRCNWDELMDYLDDGEQEAMIRIVQITKGRFQAFSGAVDNLQINDTVYDFEPNGVFPTP